MRRVVEQEIELTGLWQGAQVQTPQVVLARGLLVKVQQPCCQPDIPASIALQEANQHLWQLPMRSLPLSQMQVACSQAAENELFEVRRSGSFGSNSLASNCQLWEQQTYVPRAPVRQ